SAVQRSDALLNLRDQRILVWFGDTRKPELVGTLAEAPEDRATFLAFGRWLTPRSAAQIERAIADLREQRQAFDLVIETTKGSLLEIQGRSAANNVAVKFISLAQARREHAELRLEYQQLRRDHDNLLGLLHSIPTPVWLRGPEGRLSWVNKAYADAVEAPDALAATSEGLELFGTGAREQIARDKRRSQIFAGGL